MHRQAGADLWNRMLLQGSALGAAVGRVLSSKLHDPLMRRCRKALDRTGKRALLMENGHAW